MIPIITKRLNKSVVSLWLIIFLLLPLLWLLMVSFGLTDNHWIPSLTSYQRICDGFFFHILWRSFRLALMSTVLSVCIAYPFCFLLAQCRRHNFLIVLVVIPFWTSSLIRMYALIGLLKTHGLLNGLLMRWHLIHTPLDLLYNQVAVVIGLSYDLFPFMVLPIYARFEKFDWSLLSAASDLGASWWYQFKTIIWPLTLPAVKNGVLMVLFPAMTLFYVSNILGGARSMLVGNYIEDQFLLINDWSGGAACSVVLMGLILVCARLLRSRKIS